MPDFTHDKHLRSSWRPEKFLVMYVCGENTDSYGLVAVNRTKRYDSRQSILLTFMNHGKTFLENFCVEESLMQKYYNA